MVGMLYYYIVYCIALFMFTYVESDLMLSTDIKYGQTLYFYLLCVFLIEVFRFILNKRNRTYRFNLLIISILYFLLISMVFTNIYSTALDPFKNIILLIFKTIIFMSLPFLIMSNNGFNEEEYLLLISKVTILFAVISSIVALWIQYIGPLNILGYNISQQYKDYTRLYGWYGNPNRFGSILGISLLFLFYLYPHVNGKRKLLMVLQAFLLGVTLLLTGSRGGILALLGGATAFIYVSMNLKSKNMLSSLFRSITRTIIKNFKYIFLLFIGIIIYTYFKPEFIEEFNRTFFYKGLDSSGRIDIWKQWTNIYDHESLVAIIFGHGHGYFSRLIGLSAHNGYLRWFVDYGLLFIFLFILLITIVMRYTFFNRHLKNKHKIIAGIIIFSLLRDITSQALFSLRIEYFYFLQMILLLSFEGMEEINNIEL